jgi:hypothetical protein
VTHAAKRKLCDKPAFERPKQPRGRVRWITFEEADKLIASCAPHLAPLVTFMLFTGCRIGEALALDWRDVDLSRSHAAFLDTKNGDRRGTPLHPRALAALANMPHRTGIVFRRPDKRPYAPKDGGGGQTGVQWSLPAGRNSRFPPSRLPPHMGDVALCRQQRLAGAHGARRMEDSRDGVALRAHERQQPSAWCHETRGKSGDCRSGKLGFSTEARPLRVIALAVAKVGVEGSNPFARSNSISRLASSRRARGSRAGSEVSQKASPASPRNRQRATLFQALGAIQ